jgi:hypothetical protein
MTLRTASDPRATNWGTLFCVMLSGMHFSVTVAAILDKSNVKNSVHFLRHCRFQKIFVRVGLYSVIFYLTGNLSCRHTFLSTRLQSYVPRVYHSVTPVVFNEERNVYIAAVCNHLPSFKEHFNTLKPKGYFM